ncbi:phospholipase A2 inhibitor gamma subunit B-like [Rhinoderma darwinii]|uniref:phospholipase A2 inhibitor gamma subunit B-like n=1 Tax=Rhinoderma darwinii TaxID=43563 RepID=UPI003F67CF8D
MKTLLLILTGYGVTFISPVSSLTCETCSAQNAATCSGANVACDPSVTSCISSLIEITYETFILRSPHKSCGFPEICDLSYSFTLDKIHIAAKAQCCKTDKCNKDIPKIAPRNMTKNGLKCPFCVQAGLRGCTPINQTLCTGLEDMCLTSSGYLGYGESPVEISYQGCATQSVCPNTPESQPNADGGNRSSCTKAVHHSNEEGDRCLPVIN